MCSIVGNEKEPQQAPPGQGTDASRAPLCIFQYSATTAALSRYMFLPSCEGHRHVQHCQACKGELHQVKHWCQSHTFLTMPHMPAAFVTLQQHVMAKCGRICRVLEYAQVCTIRTSALTWWSSL